MKRVFSHQNPMIVGNARGLLETAGVKVALRNEYALGAVGELAAFDAWPELWVVNDSDCQRALQLLAERLTDEVGPDWVCSRCDELNAASFETCWACGGAAPTAAP